MTAMLARYGVGHARQLLVAPNGNLISSEDKLTAPKGLSSPEGLIAGAYRHPLPSASERERAARRRRAERRSPAPNGETWRISSNAPGRPSRRASSSPTRAGRSRPRKSCSAASIGGRLEVMDRVEYRAWRQPTAARRRSESGCRTASALPASRPESRRDSRSRKDCPRAALGQRQDGPCRVRQGAERPRRRDRLDRRHRQAVARGRAQGHRRRRDHAACPR